MLLFYVKQYFQCIKISKHTFTPRLWIKISYFNIKKIKSVEIYQHDYKTFFFSYTYICANIILLAQA